MRVMVFGDAAFERFAVACETAAGPDFDKHMRHGLKLAGQDIGQAVITASPIYTPSGYDEVFQSRLRAETEVDTAQLKATVVVYARGRTGHRDVRRIEEGRLRAPNWGRTRVLKAGGRYAKKPENIRGGVYMNPWHEQRIRPHFFSEPVHYASPRAFKRIEVALGDVLQQIGRDA